MKTIALIFIISWLGGGGLHPSPISEDDKIINAMTVKNTVKAEVKQWELTKAYYQRVIMPDGTKQELKSRTLLTKEQWLVLAKNIYRAKLEEQKEPDMCPHCGRPMP